jgi:hypothetical protein
MEARDGGARGRNRTVTAREGLGILSPVRLPVSPPGQGDEAILVSHKKRAAATQEQND